jgi:hypothetical protein
METQITITETTVDNAISVIASGSPVVSVNHRIGAVMLSSTDVGLGNVDNTSDLDKPISIATLSAIGFLQDEINILSPDNSYAVHTVVQSTSANWNDGYSYIVANSGIEANQQEVSTFVNTNSSNIIEVDTLVNTTSGNWDTAYNVATTYQNASGSFATNTILQSNSALLTPLTLANTITSQLVLNTFINNLTGNWNSAYASTTALNLSSLYWNDAYTYVIGNSGIESNQQQASTFVNTNSANILAVDTNVNTNSAVFTGFQDQSANNVSVYTTVQNNSAVFTVGSGAIPVVIKYTNFNWLASGNPTVKIYDVPSGKYFIASSIATIITRSSGTWVAGTMPGAQLRNGTDAALLGTLTLRGSSSYYGVNSYDLNNTTGAVRAIATDSVNLKIITSNSGTSYNTLLGTIIVTGYLI